MREIAKCLGIGDGRGWREAGDDKGERNLVTIKKKGQHTSAPNSPTNLAIGPIYHFCAMHRIAPAQPTRNATRADKPRGSLF